MTMPLAAEFSAAACKIGLRSSTAVFKNQLWTRTRERRGNDVAKHYIKAPETVNKDDRCSEIETTKIDQHHGFPLTNARGLPKSVTLGASFPAGLRSPPGESAEDSALSGGGFYSGKNVPCLPR